jgi:hypothetical protein
MTSIKSMEEYRDEQNFKVKEEKIIEIIVVERRRV